MTTHQPRTVTTRVVTEINRTAILDALLVHGPLSRKQIVKHTGLGSATVERLCAALLADRRIVIDGLERSPAGGRPSYLLRYSGSARAVVAIEVADAGTRGRLVDLDGVTLAEESTDFVAHGPADATSRLDGTIGLAQSLVARSAELDITCEGIGISVPGIVHDGRVMNTVELGWRDVPLGSIVENRTSIRTIVENDANAIAFGEWSIGAATGAHSVASYVLGAGVGAGVVNDGRIYHGARSAAGEVGYLFADTSALGRYFTEQGDLESRIAALDVGRGADAGGADAGGADAGGADATGGRGPAIQRLLDPLAADDPTLGPAVAELFDLIAFSCGAIATVMDPEVIVLAGHLTHSPEHTIRELTSRLVGRIPFPPRFLVSSLGTDAALAGIGELVSREIRGATYIT